MGATRPVKLIALDFGTTTSKALIVAARYHSDGLGGRSEIRELGEPYRSDIVFTPFLGERIDEARICALLDGWLAAASAAPEDIVGGGAIITGLCARRANAADLAALIRARIGGAVIATADDPGLESFLAFMGGAAALSRARPGVPILNLDIGGGTTNLALGIDGEVLQVGCLFVGARHVEVVPGSYRVAALSQHALRLFAALGITARPGDMLTPEQVAAVLEFQALLLEAAVSGREAPFQTELGRAHVDLPLQLPGRLGPLWLTFSGGVGELLYARLQGHAAPATTAFGDLGIDLAARILASPLLCARLLVPAGGGRATAYGLLRNLTRLSGATIYLPRPELLPLDNLPIFGRISSTSSDEQIHASLGLVRRSARGGCLAVSLAGPAAVKTLGRRLGEALRIRQFPDSLPLVLLVPDNVGKALGAYVSDWGRLPVTVIVLDEVDPRGARFVQIGRLVEQVVPVSFYGMGPADHEVP
ncbi:MAG: ethanolamine ammonia-lyase reactivating factor EutA [Nannocystis sp.]|nr:ethanolamine ammonia-lyase reactivating factor EutA [Nannocystis sp.]MBA3548161.1 ethanolamine ammonia-lyase reactivating factor EutA [Nannocystis sp.]